MTWKVMQRNVWADIANLRIKRLNNSTKYHSMHWWPSCQGRRIEIRRRIVKSMLSKFSEMLKYMARIGRPNILWSVNKLARAVTKWTKACDTSLASLISYIHHTSEYWQYCYVGNTAQQCRLGLFLDSNFAGDPEDSKSTSGGLLCIFGSHTFVPRNWICKKQTSVSHSSTKAEIISLWTVFPLSPCGIWWLKDFIPYRTKTEGPKREPRGNPSAVVKQNMHNTIPIKHTNVIPTNIDNIPSNTKNSGPSALSHVFEDNKR